MYQALYRKWRPKTFDDVVGQEHVTETLKRQVMSGRTSHAYLFTGTRGTGKTTDAKILAKAVNCLNPVNGNPCNCCDICLGIENKSIYDVAELDAASNNKVDAIRSLLEEARYSPQITRKRVYIIDEVHMLSAQAFNALLQILEEPPSHVMFILATTEVRKVPATIKSRCQQFMFKRIPAEKIVQRLLYVAEQEHMQLTEEAAGILARLADGGLRDALSLLDQCTAIAGPDGTLDASLILDTMGLTGNIEIEGILDDIAASNTAGALERLGKLYTNGKEMSSVASELATLVRDVLTYSCVPNAAPRLMTGGYDTEILERFKAAFEPVQLVQMLNLIQKTRASLKNSGHRRTDMELCLVTLCNPVIDSSLYGLSNRVRKMEKNLAAGGIPVQTQQYQQPPQYQPQTYQQPQQPQYPPQQRSTQPQQSYQPQQRPAQPQPYQRPQQQPQQAQPRPQRPAQPYASQQPAPQPRPQAPAAPRPQPQAQPVQQPVQEPAPQQPAVSNWPGWEAFSRQLKPLVPPGCSAFISNGAMCRGQWDGRGVVLWVVQESIKSILDTPDVTQPAAALAKKVMGFPCRVELKVGIAPPDVQGVLGNPNGDSSGNPTGNPGGNPTGNGGGGSQDPLEAFLADNPGLFIVH